MKNLILATCMTALIATQAAATYKDPPKEEPPRQEQPRQEQTGGNGDLLVVLGVIGAVVLLRHLSNRGTQADLSEPRPLVRPQTCMNKHGLYVVCE